jgi:hypothetical protein
MIGEAWAKNAGIPVKRFPADWHKYKRAAGFVRNVEMSKHADALLAIWDGKSAGTSMMIDIARRRGLRVVVYQPTSSGGSAP